MQRYSVLRKRLLLPVMAWSFVLQVSLEDLEYVNNVTEWHLSFQEIHGFQQIM